MLRIRYAQRIVSYSSTERRGPRDSRVLLLLAPLCFVFVAQVNRKNLLEDSFAQVSAMNAGELRRWLRVRPYDSIVAIGSNGAFCVRPQAARLPHSEHVIVKNRSYRLHECKLWETVNPKARCVPSLERTRTLANTFTLSKSNFAICRLLLCCDTLCNFFRCRFPHVHLYVARFKRQGRIYWWHETASFFYAALTMQNFVLRCFRYNLSANRGSTREA